MQRKGWFAISCIPVLAAALVLQLPGAAAAGSRPAPQERTSSVHAGGGYENVIVILRAQNAALPTRSAARIAAARTEQAPVVAQMRAAGARSIVATSLLNAVSASVPRAAAAAIAADPAVARVIPDTLIAGPVVPTVRQIEETASPVSRRKADASGGPCGTSSSPEVDPEALTNIDALNAQALGYDGAGVTVGYLADGVDTTIPDFQRNAAYASPGSPAGSPVVTQVNFSGDPATAPTPGGEAFLDASSIAAQGGTTHDLAQFVSSAHPLPPGCDIKIIGAAPGASVMAMKVFASDEDTTTSGFIQAIDYAVTHGVKVINESFGSNNFPDTTLDAIRGVDDAAVAAGVTVVVSSGDAGTTSTIGSPASDPNVISVGATTTFRAYAQDAYGGITDPHATAGSYLDDNISSLSSGGFTQTGSTVDLVAPGDLNWAECSANTTLFTECTNENGAASAIEITGGTSESAPLTSGAAADVIQAYASTHGGTDPTPALVKQILMSTASDIGAPATEQGAGLLDVEAAVKLATSINGSTASPTGGILVSPNQINVVQAPTASSTHTITVTNAGGSTVSVQLSTRALTSNVGSNSGSFCMQPGTATMSCPANTGTFPIWSGVTEVYQDVPFDVPVTSGGSYLTFTADYRYTGQTSLLHVALIEPNGAYAGYSLPQGLADFARIEVATPVAGTWTAVFFTEQNGATSGGVGTSGTVQWDASTDEYTAPEGVSPSSLTLAAGHSATAQVTLTSSSTSGDSSQSILVGTFGAMTTIPVTIRTIVPTTSTGGSFSGVLTGGNGRSAPAQTNTYVFDVPTGVRDVETQVTLSSDPNDEVVGYLVNPAGQTIGYGTNVTLNSSGSPETTLYVNLYAMDPTPGQWWLVLQWMNPVGGTELTEPFTGTIGFNQVDVTANLPQSPYAELDGGGTYTYRVAVKNTGHSPEAFFADPRTSGTEHLGLVDQNGSATDMSLPLAPGLSFPYYVVPPDTGTLSGTLQGTVPMSFDMEYYPGDPDVSPAVPAPGVTGTQSGDGASLQVSEQPEVSPGLWLLNPDEIGPYPASGAPSATATATMTATTAAFDTSVTTPTGDMWALFNNVATGSFNPVYVLPGESTTIDVTIKPDAAPGTVVRGTLHIDDYNLGSQVGVDLPDGQQLAAIPYSYKVRSTSPGYSMAAGDGGVFHFGAGQFYGSGAGSPLTSPVVGMAPTPDFDGYLLATKAGDVLAYGDAKLDGSLAGRTLAAPIVGVASDATGLGYWLVGADGGVFAFGDAPFFGSLGSAPPSSPIVGMAPTSDGLGYWLVSADGHIYSFGDATFHGSPAASGLTLGGPIVGITSTAGGYRLVASDGGVFAYGDATYRGSMGGKRLAAPMVGIAGTPDEGGYWTFAADGGVFAFGDAPFLGSMAGLTLRQPVMEGASANG